MDRPAPRNLSRPLNRHKLPPLKSLRPCLLRFQSNRGVLLIASRGNLEEDCAAIARARASGPELRILLIGMAKDAEEFLRCIRAGIDGYLLRDASAQEVLEAVRAVHGGDSVCPRSLCSVLFDYVASRMPG